MTQTTKAIDEITKRIIERSKPTREAYLEEVELSKEEGPVRNALSCGNLAHGFAACGPAAKNALKTGRVPNIGIITSYNDMLSAHQPYERFPALIKEAAEQAGGVAQVAGGVPAMCDGVTQGQRGMELSLFSRDVIAMATAVGLSHNMFDAALFLGVCDKIVPGLLIGALAFGHVPAVFVPAGPMPSGLPNDEKLRIRQLYAQGKVGRDELLDSEMQSYHSPGTCTFYGTANSNQMLMEFMGLHLPGSSFVNPDTPLRDVLTKEAAKQALLITAKTENYTPIADVITEKAIVNGVVGLHATGGSTNHALHLVAIARAAGIQLELEDLSDLADCAPLIARVYPNGPFDVNHFHAAGGLPLLIQDLLQHGLLHHDVKTVFGDGLSVMAQEPKLDGEEKLKWVPAAKTSGNAKIISTVSEPFSPNGGLKVLKGNIGTGIIKISAVKDEHQIVEAPARVFDNQEDVLEAYKAGELNCDCVVVCRFQGPAANGMPELHKLTPALGVLQDKGYKVALLTDGRMSGASGKVPAAIHVSPEAARGGAISKIVDGDQIRISAKKGEINIHVADVELDARPIAIFQAKSRYQTIVGMFENLRHSIGSAQSGASVLSDVTNTDLSQSISAHADEQVAVRLDQSA